MAIENSVYLLNTRDYPPFATGVDASHTIIVTVIDGLRVKVHLLMQIRNTAMAESFTMV